MHQGVNERTVLMDKLCSFASTALVMGAACLASVYGFSFFARLFSVPFWCIVGLRRFLNLRFYECLVSKQTS